MDCAHPGECAGTVEKKTPGAWFGKETQNGSEPKTQRPVLCCKTANGVLNIGDSMSVFG